MACNYLKLVLVGHVGVVFLEYLGTDLGGCRGLQPCASMEIIGRMGEKNWEEEKKNRELVKPIKLEKSSLT